MTSRLTTLALAATATLAAAGPAAAQDAVPMELVRLLVPAGRAMADVAVGRLPVGFPEGVVPAGARVVGGVRGGYETMAAAAVPQAPREAEAAFRRALQAAGWTDVMQLRQQTGFISSVMETPNILCQGERAINFTAIPRDAGGSYLRISLYSPETNYSPCERQQLQPGPRESRLPTLVGPPGVRVFGTGSGSSSDGSESTRARIRAATAPAQLLAHYAAELERAGWTPSPPVANAELGQQTFRKRDAAGKELFGLLSAVAYPGSDARDLQFAITPLPLAAMP